MNFQFTIFESPGIFSSEVFHKNFSHQQHKNKMLYAHTPRLEFQELVLGGASFYNFSVRDIFCEHFTQHCYVSVNTENVVLEFVPYFTQFLDD